MKKVSVVISSFRRPELLRLGLSSILRFMPPFPFEIIVVNDYIQDSTEQVCKDFCAKGLDVKYIFSGQRNLDGVIKRRVSGFALNIGIKQSTGDVIVLSCPEMFHLSDILTTEVLALESAPRSMVIPVHLYFDDGRAITNYLLNLNDEELKNPKVDLNLLKGGHHNDDFSPGRVMPFLMAIRKEEIIDVGGIDEQFIGAAGEDNDFCERLLRNNVKYLIVSGSVIHLWHEGHNSGKMHEDDPQWVYNWNLLLESRKTGKIVANVGKEWGEIDG